MVEKVEAAPPRRLRRLAGASHVNLEGIGSAVRVLPVAKVLGWVAEAHAFDGKEWRLHCPGKQHTNGDQNPSLSVATDWRFYCQVCKIGGTNPVSLVAMLKQWPNAKAAEEVCHEFIHPVVPIDAIHLYRKRLTNTDEGQIFLKALLDKRGITPETADKMKLGLDETFRITIPIQGPHGLYRDLRRWDAFRRTDGPKMMPYSSGFGKGGIWWPPESTTGTTVMVCEGEPDTIRAISAGYEALTVTCGAKSFGLADWRWVEGKSVILCLDPDPAGQVAEALALERLAQHHVARVKRVSIPKPFADFTDWIHTVGEKRTREAIDSLSWDTAGDDARKPIALVDIGKAALVGSEVTLEGQVSVVSGQSYLVPEVFRVICNQDAGSPCDACPNRDQGGTGRYQITSRDPAFMEAIEANDPAVNKVLRRHAGIASQRCKIEIQRLTCTNALRVTLVPSTLKRNRQTRFVSRDCVYVGNDLAPGTTAQFSGYTRHDPNTQAAVTILTQKTSDLAPHEEFKIRSEEIDEIRSFYDGRDPYEAVQSVAEIVAKYYTKITGRRNLHVLLDLVWHSILEIPYGGKTEPGWLDALVVGSTTTGKTETVKGFISLYGLGEILSGKRCTAAGLIGGTVRHGKGFDIAVGACSLHDGGLVAIDEAVHPEILSVMTRPRRDGIAEFTQAGASQSALARCRKIWTMNPPKGRPLEDYRFGAEVLRELAQHEEDVARWDVAVGLTSNVHPDDITRASDPVKGEAPIAKDLLQAKARWAWSRKTHHVRWEAAAREAVVEEARELVAKYTVSTVGLIQKGNTHQKLRKFAAALAATTFSSPDGEHLIIQEVHVRSAARILRDILDEDSLRLGECARTTCPRMIQDKAAVLQAIQRLGRKSRPTMRRLLAQGPAPRPSWESLVPSPEAKSVVDLFIREGGLRDDGFKLTMTREFADVLQAKLRLFRRAVQPGLESTD